jgi:hypothetical protein
VKVGTILRLFQSGVIAACIQGFAVVFLTPLVILYTESRADGLSLPNADPMALHPNSLLRLMYLLIAAGLALTRHRFVDQTAKNICRASRLMHPSDPDRAAGILLVSLVFTTVGFAAEALSSPPVFLTEFGWQFGSFDAAPIIWSAAMSIGAASFGANAHAAAQATVEAWR